MEDDEVNGYMAEGNKRRKMDDKDEVIPDSVNPISYIDWCIKDNARKHKTIKYDLVHDQQSPTPVLRRGQPFKIIVNYTDRDFSREWDRVVLTLKFGSVPLRRKGTLIVLNAVNDSFTLDHDEWDVMIDQETSFDKLVLQVSSPSDVPVGLWRLEVRSELKKSFESHLSEESEAYIIFNPWCKDDIVYMSAEDKLEEYVLNDNGILFAGGYYLWPNADPWAYGQFDDVVLPLAEHILGFAKFRSTGRGSAVQVARAISAGVNHDNDGGILVGKWTDDFSDGVAPWEWAGSVRILEEYKNSGYQPVKYGQCWVFSAVVVTICRALGIPCRSVTNYQSAHDTNNSLTIDKFFDDEGNIIEGGPDGDITDSIWNFHVWNDVWMARPDLPPGYGGWQVIDATPQEESENKKQCGPASLVAVRRGEIGFNYDVPFVFSEVNADVMHWQKDDTSDWGWSRLEMVKNEVGLRIWTKHPEKDDDLGYDDGEDITLQYKSKEGTAAERLSIHNAIRGCKLAKQYYEHKTSRKKDVSFDLHELNKIKIGDPFQVQIVMTNKSSEERTVTAALTAHSTYYTGIIHKKIKKTDDKFTLAAGEKKSVILNVAYNEYWKQLVPGCLIKMYVICRVSETGQTYTDEDNFAIEKPKLQIQVSENATAHEPCQATFMFKNPLNIPLTKCRLSVEGAGLLKSMAIAIEEEVEPNGQFKHSVEFNPRIHGRRKLIACFNSLELFNINGVKSIHIKKK